MPLLKLGGPPVFLPAVSRTLHLEEEPVGLVWNHMNGGNNVAIFANLTGTCGVSPRVKTFRPAQQAVPLQPKDSQMLLL